MNLRKFLAAASALSLVSLSGAAFAVTNTGTNSRTSDSQPNNSPGLAASLLTVTGLNNAGLIGGAVSSFVQGGGQSAGLDVKRFALGGGRTGQAAAPGAQQWNAWTAFSHSNIAYTYAPLNSSGNVNVYLAGVDYTFANNMVFGVAIAHDDTDVNLNFSGGTLSGNGNTISPYLGIPINKNLAFDGTLGYGRVTIDTNVAGVAGSTKDNRALGAVGLTYRDVRGDWTLTGRGAWLYVRDKLDGYVLSNATIVPEASVNLSQIRLVGEVAYTAGSFSPFFSLAYINDVKRVEQLGAANDRDGWTPTIGVRFKLDNSIYGGIRYSTEQNRKEIKNDQFLFHLGIRF